MDIASKQFAALNEFISTLKRRPERFCWREPFPESKAHRWWRCNAYALYRFRLWLRAGMDEFPGFRAQLHRLVREERAARRACNEEHRQEMVEFRRSETAQAEGLTVPRPGDIDYE